MNQDPEYVCARGPQVGIARDGGSDGAGVMGRGHRGCVLCEGCVRESKDDGEKVGWWIGCSSWRYDGGKREYTGVCSNMEILKMEFVFGIDSRLCARVRCVLSCY